MANNHSKSGASERGPRVAVESGDEDLEAVAGTPAGSRRRTVLRVLEDGEERTQDRRSLALRVAAAESSESVAAIDDRRRRHVAISLHHNHLPALEDAGLLEYDHETGLTTYDPPAELERQVRALLE